MTTDAVAVLGLGSMGSGMAGALLRAGHVVHGIDVDPGRMAAFREAGGASGALADVAPGLGAAVVVVLNAGQTEAVLFGGGSGGGGTGGDAGGLVPRMAKGAVVIACATVPPAFARDMAARCAAHGVHYLDAPISGGAAKAAAGALSIMASGTPEAFAAADAVLGALAERVFRLGDTAGAGSAMKAVNQLLAGVHIAAMAEAMTFGMTQGVTSEAFMAVIPDCAGTSWMLENRGPHVVEGDYAPRSSVDIWPKDLGIVLDIAREAGFDAPVATAALGQFRAAAAAGLGGEDDAAVAKVYAQQAGLTLPGAAR